MTAILGLDYNSTKSAKIVAFTSKVYQIERKVNKALDYNRSNRSYSSNSNDNEVNKLPVQSKCSSKPTDTSPSNHNIVILLLLPHLLVTATSTLEISYPSLISLELT